MSDWNAIEFLPPARRRAAHKGRGARTSHSRVIAATLADLAEHLDVESFAAAGQADPFASAVRTSKRSAAR